MKLRNTIIYLIGIPAVGKYTTAKAIERATGAKVIDNHLINYPIFTIVGYDGTNKIPVKKEAWIAVAKIGNVVRDFIRDHADPDASFVFTNVLNDEPGDRRLFRRIERLAKHRNATFVPVWISCDVAEVRKRKNRPDRRQRLKDIDLTNIRYWFEEFKLLVVKHPNELRLDTTRSKPEETAKKIVAHARCLARRS
jgi:tRNA uridine 5-carbamoylmethylation protein Kti12